MKITVSNYIPEDSWNWDEYVSSHPKSSLYHLSSFKTIIEESYEHKARYLVATAEQAESTEPKIVGILPLIHMKSLLFGNNLISMPFFDVAGILSNDEAVERSLISRAIEMAKKLNAQTVELRQCITGRNFNDYDSKTRSGILCQTRTDKSRLLLKLPETSQQLMKSFRSKLRSQIKKPIKEGLEVKIGFQELIPDFYRVFSINMRDLGSPVHSVRIIRKTLMAFPDTARVIVVHYKQTPVAAGLVIGFKDTLANPWASALREYSRMAPNMLLYWKMLEFACEHGYRQFDFGRSTPDEGTYKFKKQWGAEPEQLYWHQISFNKREIGLTPNKDKFRKIIQVWKKLPLPVTIYLGPLLRKHIAL